MRWHAVWLPVRSWICIPEKLSRTKSPPTLIPHWLSISVTLPCDTNHVLQSDCSEVRYIGAGADAVDFALVNLYIKGDIVVTKDYSGAVMALGKGAYAIHQSGLWYTNDNRYQMLMERHLAKKARRAQAGTT